MLLVPLALVGEVLAVAGSRVVRPALGAAGFDIEFPTVEPTRVVLLVVALIATTACVAPGVRRLMPHRGWLFAAAVAFLGTAVATTPQAFELSAFVEDALLGPRSSADLDLIIRLPIFALIGATATSLWMLAWDRFLPTSIGARRVTLPDAD